MRRFLTGLGLLGLALGAGEAMAASPWAGAYAFDEAIPGATMSYRLRIRETGLQADLDVDGFQTMLRLRCAVEGGGPSRRVILRGFREPGLSAYHAGDLLFTLERRGGVLRTHWGKMRPQLGPKGSSKGEGFQRMR